MNIEFQCEPIPYGAVRLRLVVGLADVELHATFFSEALDDLAGAVEAVLRGHPAPRVVLVDAPMEFRCLLEAEAQGRVRVRVLAFPDYPSGQRDEQGRPLMDTTCEVLALATAMASCLATLQTTYGVRRFEDIAKMQLPVQRQTAIETLLHGAHNKQMQRTRPPQAREPRR